MIYTKSRIDSYFVQFDCSKMEQNMYTLFNMLRNESIKIQYIS